MSLFQHKMSLKGFGQLGSPIVVEDKYDGDMWLIMNDESLPTMEQIKRFPEGSEAAKFKAIAVEEKYEWTEGILRKFRYHRLKRSEKGVIRRQYI